MSTKPATAGDCLKQHVVATAITPDGRRFVGTNWIATPPAVCPRASMPTGVGYDLCKSVCNQSAHAEVNALRAATAEGNLWGSVLYIEGHTYACKPCALAAWVSGATIVIGAPPEAA